MNVIHSSLALTAVILVPLAHAQTTYTFTSVDYPGAAFTVLNGINSSGAIVGTYSPTVAGYPLYSFLRSPDGSFTPLLVGTLSNATGISDSGIIVGSAGSTANNRRVGFILSNTLDLIDSSVYDSSLNGISTNDSIVGAFVGLGGAHGFVTAGGKLTQLPYFQERPVLPTGINSEKTIVASPQSTPRGALILPDGGAYQVVQYRGAPLATTLNAINDAGVTAGTQFGSPNGYGQGFTYNGAVFSDVIYPGSVDTYPLGINNSGIVVGEYIDSSLATHGFIATPIP